MINWLKKKENFIPIILFVLAVLPFLFNLRGFFLSDDWDFLTQVAGSHQPLWRYFFTNYTGTHAGGSYRPFTVFFWFAAYHFWQLNFFWYHLVQIIFHAGCAVLLYLIVLNSFWPVKKTGRLALATIAAIIFAFLPDHSEAVAWLAAVCDTLCSFFYFASLLLLLLCLKFSRAKYWLYAGSLLLFLAALFTKEMAMSLPFIVLIFAIYYYLQNRFRGTKIISILSVVPYFIILAGYFWLRYRATGLFFGYYGEAHLHLGLAKIVAMYFDIGISFVLSDQLRAVFSLWLNHNLLIVAAISILSAAGLIYLTWKKKMPVWPWLVFLSLVASIAPIAALGINLTAAYTSEEGERYGYLPSVFFAILLAALIVAIWKKIDNKLSLRGSATGGDEAIQSSAIGTRLLRFARNDKKKIIFAAVIIIFAAGLASQLLIKNWRYQQAGVVAQTALRSAVAEMRQGDYQGALFFGLPDNFHGAPIFRNGWQEAIAFYLPEPPIILAPFNRTAYEADQKFSAVKVDNKDFNYSSAGGKKFILAKPNFSSVDYSTVLKNYIFELSGINDRYFGSELDIALSADLASNAKVALFFWNGSGWDVLNTKQ